MRRQALRRYQLGQLELRVTGGGLPQRPARVDPLADWAELALLLEPLPHESPIWQAEGWAWAGALEQVLVPLQQQLRRREGARLQALTLARLGRVEEALAAIGRQKLHKTELGLLLKPALERIVVRRRERLR